MHEQEVKDVSGHRKTISTRTGQLRLVRTASYYRLLQRVTSGSFWLQLRRVTSAPVSLTSDCSS